MKKILFIVLLCGLACLSLDAQKPLRKPQKTTQSSNTGNGGKNNSAARPSKQPAKSGSSAPRIVATGSIKGHDYVDLGLSVKWATCNVGATSPADYGDYFAWGETSPKSEYTVENSVTYKKNMGDIAGDSRYDAARANWGGSWRMPTSAEINELESKCKTRWITRKGYLFTGPNGKSIFLPAAGWRSGSSQSGVGDCGYYWTPNPNESDSECAYSRTFCDDGIVSGWDRRSNGRTVRPVSE